MNLFTGSVYSGWPATDELLEKRSSAWQPMGKDRPATLLVPACRVLLVRSQCEMSMLYNFADKISIESASR